MTLNEHVSNEKKRMHYIQYVRRVIFFQIDLISVCVLRPDRVDRVWWASHYCA